MSNSATFTEVYVDGIRFLANQGYDVEPVIDKNSPGSHFGGSRRRTKEILNYTFSLSNPRDRILCPHLRKTNIVFAIANCIWTLRGTEDASIIIKYNPKGANFSRDGLQYEAAFGSRLFGVQKQIDNVVRRLKDDPSSRRAFAAIYDASDTVNDRLDVPCALGLQFFVRNGKLSCVAVMRSQSAIKVLPYDVFLFTVIHEIVAARLALPLGDYIHHSISFHIYDDEYDLSDLIVDYAPSHLAERATPAIRSVSTNDLEKVFECEEMLRKAKNLSDIEGVNTCESHPDEFWRSGLSVLKIFFMRYHGGQPEKAQWNWLPLIYQELLW